MINSTLAQLLARTVDDGASDLHLTVGAPPCYRIHGEMTALGTELLEKVQLRDMLVDVLNGEQQNLFGERHDIDISLEIENLARFRVNLFTGRRGDGGVFRVIPTRIKSCEELGLPETIRDLSKLHNGLVLVTGPTGSGKSTTLAAIVDLINEQRRGHILTVEDPIEFVHPHKNCLVNQREVKVHTETFSSALRAALREDPDVILVGEMRDLETISLAISAAETGHLVLGTLHTSSAAQTIDRIIDVFPPHQQQQVRTMLSESLQAVVSQQLVPKVGGGRVAIHEILLGLTSVRNLIREGKTFQIPSIIETNNNIGMITHEQSLEAHLKKGLITTETAITKGLDAKIAESIAPLEEHTFNSSQNIASSAANNVVMAEMQSVGPVPTQQAPAQNLLLDPPVSRISPLPPLDDDLDLKPLNGNQDRFAA